MYVTLQHIVLLCQHDGSTTAVHCISASIAAISNCSSFYLPTVYNCCRLEFFNHFLSNVGVETTKMNLCQAVNNAMDIAMETDNSAVCKDCDPIMFKSSDCLWGRCCFWWSISLLIRITR